MRRLVWLLWAIALAAAGCETRPPNEEAGELGHVVPVASGVRSDTGGRARRPMPPALPLDTEMAGPWMQLQRAWLGHDAALLNQLIDPTLGLWVVGENDAGVVITRVVTGTAFRQVFARLPLQSTERALPPCSELLAVARLPEIDCGNRVNGRSGFEQDGCFTGPPTEFRALDLWARARLKGATPAQGRAAQARVARTVLLTSSGFRFHFARTPAGRWCLVFIDLRAPCIS